MKIKCLLRLVAIMLILFGCSNAKQSNNAKNNTIVGDWRTSEENGILHISNDGEISAYGEIVGEIIDESILKIDSYNGKYVLKGNELIINIDDEEITFTRIGSSTKSSQIGKEDPKINEILRSYELQVASFSAGNSLILNDVLDAEKELERKRNKMTQGQIDRFEKAIKKAHTGQ